MPYRSPPTAAALLEHDLEHLHAIRRRLQASPDLSPHSEIVSDALSALALVFTSHFSRKEHLLTLHGADPGRIAATKSRHDELLRRYVALCEGTSLGRQTVVHELLELLECCLLYPEPWQESGATVGLRAASQ